ncbi:protein tyrosine phosphatase [Prodigiosinella aquatilis]|nr:protein tyrosine phosphatase [Prodigiosinella sp. LS101]WJV52641.1 protein tyrosine phosphatase [Prodigiosinella sp. LS101]WJV56995.1 protein tyrosine phosphatase [Pectobacteriaceae bacterium C111]
MFSSIVVVCMGNICRSPLGKALLEAQLPGINIDSAGLGALVDCPADPKAQEIALRHGLNLEHHRAKSLTVEMCYRFDLILVMEKCHIDMVENIAAEVRGKTFLFGHWGDRQDINDPYRKDILYFESTYQLLNLYSKKWAKALKS